METAQMIDFKTAIKLSEENLKDIQSTAKGIRVEQATIDEDKGLFEITLSFNADDSDGIEIGGKPEGIAALYKLSAFNRLYKTFLIDRNDGSFKGFKIFKQD